MEKPICLSDLWQSWAIATLCLASPSTAWAGPIFDSGKLLLTNGVTSIEGASGGGLSTWAVIAGRETERGIGLSAHVTLVELNDYGWESHGVAAGLWNRVEVSYARQNLDTRKVGAALGLGKGYMLNQDVIGAKLRVAGDVVYGPASLPQITLGVQHKRNLDPSVVYAVGGQHGYGTDFTISAT